MFEFFTDSKAVPRATLTPLLCSPNFPRAQYLNVHTLTHELIVKYSVPTKLLTIHYLNIC